MASGKPMMPHDDDDGLEGMSDRTLLESIRGTYHYHLDRSGGRAECGEHFVMKRLVPERTWGYRGHLRETYCQQCPTARAQRKGEGR